ncbi:hypothetical protein NPIL_244611 [Nephila pilipes]|uniref:Uncharacterized protein n=1 Tax=Nephila pilipes TaxID=299642 RepID=A0A8X6NJQ4_NEPPI|nr:hypothetical protein NPIL_244611 [Nephila pilipes]
MDGVDTPGILNTPTAKSLLVSDLETEMLRIEDGGKPSVCQLPLHCYSLQRILTLMFRALKVSALDLVGRTLHDPRAIQFPQIAEQALRGLPLIKAFF